MPSETVKKKSWTGKDVEVLGETYESGKPETMDRWRGKISTREEMLKYLKSGERYWYAEEGYGSEKRKTPA